MFPFRNLVFQGGGSKALAYHGAVQVLEQEGILDDIERVAGTSAGAALATMLSMRLDMAEILRVYRSFDVDGFIASLSGRIPDRDSPPRFLQRELERLQGNFASIARLATRFGWNSFGFYHVWLQDTLALYCNGQPKATFGQFREWGFRDLYIVATNITKRKAEIFSADTTPNVAVADALVMSQSLPLFFEGLQFDGLEFGLGDHYADGGMMLNYPLPVFDDRSFARNNRWFVNGVNWESLGCRLYTPGNCPQERGSISNLLTYLQSTFESLVEAQAIAFELSKSAQRRTINIDDRCVGTTDFSVRPEPGNQQYQRLVLSGEEAAHEYLAKYKPPLIKPLLPFTLYFDRARRGIKKWYAGVRNENVRS